MTEGGVSGERLDRLGEGSQWAGSEMNILVDEGAKAKFDGVSAKELDEESSEDLLLLFEATVMRGSWMTLIGFGGLSNFRQAPEDEPPTLFLFLILLVAG